MLFQLKEGMTSSCYHSIMVSASTNGLLFIHENEMATYNFVLKYISVCKFYYIVSCQFTVRNNYSFGLREPPARLSGTRE